MTRFILLRTGATDFDTEGRIKGTLNIPLNDAGNEQALAAANALREENVSVVYHSPSECDEQTAKVVAEALGLRAKVVKDLQNLDQGLWQGEIRFAGCLILSELTPFLFCRLGSRSHRQRKCRSPGQ